MIGEAILAATLAVAVQEVCAEPSAIAKALMLKYGETVVGQEIRVDNTIVVTFANPLTGTFTVVRLVGVQACVIAAGVIWPVHKKMEGTDI